jgi:REP element-mobilizing transposase RayT
MNRGRRRENIFSSSEDYQAFIKVLQEAAELWGIKITAYCLMSNHYHLLVQTPDANLSRCMRHINGIYTQRFNRRRKIEGQLFRGRYKAILIEEDSHLLEVLRYIHRNPLRAGLVKDIKDFPWSSHHGYLSRSQKWGWLNKDFLMSMLSDKQSRRLAAYKDFVSLDDSEETERFYSLKNLSSVMGSDVFKEWIKDQFQHLCFREEIPESRLLAPSIEEVIAKTCEHFHVSKEQLFISRRGHENLPRNVALYLVRILTRKSMPEIGKQFEVSNYSTVGSVVERMKQREAKEPDFQKKVLGKIKDNLAKSQERT